MSVETTAVASGEKTATTTAAAMMHLSVPIHDVDQASHFYEHVLGCYITRRQSDRLDIDFFGHHLVAQLSATESAHRSINIGKDQYPLRHYGVIVQPPVYDRLLSRLIEANVLFAMQPTRLFEGTPREQLVFLVKDPSGNALEVKGMMDPNHVFSAL